MHIQNMHSEIKISFKVPSPDNHEARCRYRNKWRWSCSLERQISLTTVRPPMRGSGGQRSLRIRGFWGRAAPQHEEKATPIDSMCIYIYMYIYSFV